ncbi:MAG: cell wall-binding repeat-containing protein [Ornithinimicrobium sp.]
MPRSRFRSHRVVAVATIALLTCAVGPGPAARGQAGGDLPAGVYVVALEELPLAVHPSTKAGVGKPLDVTSEDATRRADALRADQDEVLADIGATALQRYDTVLNGFAVNLSADQADALSRRTDVLSLTPDEPGEISDVGASGVPVPQTDQSPDALGLTGPDGAWAQLGGPGNAGRHHVIGVIDSGIDAANPSFSATGMPSPPGEFTGGCEGMNFGVDWSPDACNNKVVAADIFALGPAAAGEQISDEDSMSPMDRDGHGSHVAAIAAGRAITLPPADGSASVTGMAPQAHLAIYKSCWDVVRFAQTLCYPQDTIAAIEAATSDGVDVINFSISGSSTSYRDAVELALRSASASGVFVATTAGNGGKLDRPVEHLSPWVTTTAAAIYTSDRGPVPSVAPLSSRGPVDLRPSQQSVAKPDIAAPGVSVLSAVAASDDGTASWSKKTGTSMAAPHVAGLSVLVAQKHPDFSPMAIKSALMTSAARFAGGDAANDPFKGGAGFTDGKAALQPGLVFDSGNDQWAEFLGDPATGYTLNAPSVQVPELSSVEPASVPRTVRNVTNSSVTYTATYQGPSTLSVQIEPETFTLDPGEEVPLQITVANMGAQPQQWQHGSVLWTSPASADVRIPVIARGDRLEQEPVEDVVERWAGSNRFGTAAKIAAEFTDPVDTVYLSSSSEYADALSAAPIAAQGIAPPAVETSGNAAPMLLARRYLPEATRQTLDELRPRNIVLLGGPEAISASVERNLAQQGYDLTRVGGVNRYGTSAKLATLHQPGLPVVYVASGDAYPDALTGSALAARDGGAVLLSRSDSVPPVISDAIASLDPDKVVVLGGPKAISEEVYQELGASERIWGPNRFQTAAEISKRFTASPKRVFVANGLAWPDALAGSVVAGSQGSPVLITRPGSVPGAIRERLESLQPEQIVVLGGETAVQSQIELELATLANTWR